jgi:hypothetical protein
MFLRFILLKGIYLIGYSREALDVSASFDHKGYAVRISFSGGEVIELSDVPAHSKYFRKSDGLQFILDDKDTRRVPLVDLTKIDNYSTLLSLMRTVAERVFNVIRNFGIVPEIPENLPTKLEKGENLQAEVLGWFPEMSADGESWAPLAKSKGFDFLPLLITSNKFSRAARFLEDAELNLALWPDIIEALEDNKEPPPEMEFLTNAIGHLRQKNFRLAVVESIVCLEIVLTQFISNYLSISAKVKKENLQRFLSPELGLTARLSGLLNLTLHESYLKEIDLDRVLKVVEWRNKIIHKNGRLPSGIDRDTLQKNVSAVFSLINVLAERRDNIVASPKLNEIADILRQKAGVMQPSIWLKSRHQVRIDFDLFSKREGPDYREKLENLLKETIELLKKRDPRFDPIQHLTICFKHIPDGSQIWYQYGKLRL